MFPVYIVLSVKSEEHSRISEKISVIVLNFESTLLHRNRIFFFRDL